MTSDTQRIVANLHKGVGTLPPKQMVYVQAGDVLTAINELWSQAQRADRLQVRLDAIEADTDLVPPADANRS